MAISVKQRERERRALGYACPWTMCRSPVGEPCYTPSRQGNRGRIPAKPRTHPHDERVELVPDWTRQAAPCSGFEPYVPTEISLLAEKYLEQALYVLRSREDPIPLVSGALALLYMDVGEQPENDLEDLREQAEDWEDQ